MTPEKAFSFYFRLTFATSSLNIHCAASVCVFKINSKSPGQIFIQFSPTGRVIFEEGFSV